MVLTHIMNYIIQEAQLFSDVCVYQHTTKVGHSLVSSAREEYSLSSENLCCQVLVETIQRFGVYCKNFIQTIT